MARDTASLVGANVDGLGVSVKAKHMITESAQDSLYSNSNGLDLSAGLSFSNKDGNKKIFTDKALSAGSGGFGIRDGYEDRVWTESVTTLTSRGKLKIDVEDEVKNKGAIIGSKTGEMNLNAKRLILEDLEDKDYAREFGLNISKIESKREEGTKSIFGNDSKSTWRETIKIENNASKIYGITYSTIGEGNIIVGEVMHNNEVITDDLENVNRDLNLNQKITRDKKTSALDGELVVDLVVADEMVYLLGKGLEGLGYGASYWHYELRDKLNNEESLPKTKEEMDSLIKNDPNSGWIELNPNEAQCHQYESVKIEIIDKNGNKETKNIEPTGLNTKYVNEKTNQEAVYNFYTGDLDTDGSVKGTYNYFTGRMPVSKGEDGLKFNWNFEMTNASNGCINVNINDMTNALGHAVCDLIPYYIGGNVRGKDPEKIYDKRNK